MRKTFIAGLALAASAVLILPGQSRAAAIKYTCDGGDVLTVAFSESSAELTLPDGVKVSLPQQQAASGFWYSNGGYELRGKGEELQFAIGRMAPVTCRNAGEVTGQFDRATRAEVELAEKDTGFDQKGKLTCLRYPNFALKQLDLGEKGAAGLYIASSEGPCQLNPTLDRKINDDIAGYLWGAVGPYAFFRGADGWNGGMPFVVYDARSGARLTEDVVAGEFSALTLVGDELTLRYRRTFGAECSLLADPEGCGKKIRQALGLAPDRAMPDCQAAYKPAIDADPNAAKDIQAWPSVVDYPVERKLSATGTSFVAVEGELTCRPAM
ncbi:MliC family protein [Rhizobium sp. AG855]|uniref:MliC family protein n=1 Tax=Rhizobium sp. AG855 TaxID=2183898 RepID=UPI000E7589B4|nr:MliC family protein [Rhizobium sp. AG855]RKE85121.1 membrane-bound lysozyme inhibitor of c-type lysozyme MliC [Rhizobium sp. AG855]